MTNCGSLMKVDCIAEFCNAFDLHYAILGLENQLSLVFLRVAVLDRFYCTMQSQVGFRKKSQSSFEIEIILSRTF